MDMDNQSYGSPEPSIIARGEDLDPDTFPSLGTISAAFIYQCLPHRADEPRAPEYVYVRCPSRAFKDYAELAMWNLKWEAGSERNELWAHELPRVLRRVRTHPDTDFRFVPWTGSTRYAAYAPLYHLLPLDTLRRFGLPPLKRGIWPALNPRWGEVVLPPDADERLARALAHHLWPLLAAGSRLNAFSRSEPLRVLAHTPDFWLPYLDLVVQKRMRALGPVEVENDRQRQAIEKAQAAAPPGVEVSRPLFGGYAWMGEEEAWGAAQELVETADRHGRLRALVDAIRSHRVEEDFSDRWSFAREDFERKLYQKRSKVKVSFVELRETVPVIGPTSEIEENLMWQDLLGLMDVKDVGSWSSSVAALPRRRKSPALSVTRTTVQSQKPWRGFVSERPNTSGTTIIDCNCS